MAQFKTLPVDSKPFVAALRKLDSCATVEQLTAMIRWYGGSESQYNAQVQSVVINTWALVTAQRGRNDLYGNLAEQIRVGLAVKVEQFGPKTFALSEKQAAVVARDLIVWTAANMAAVEVTA